MEKEQERRSNAANRMAKPELLDEEEDDISSTCGLAEVYIIEKDTNDADSDIDKNDELVSDQEAGDNEERQKKVGTKAYKDPKRNKNTAAEKRKRVLTEKQKEPNTTRDERVEKSDKYTINTNTSIEKFEMGRKKMSLRSHSLWSSMPDEEGVASVPIILCVKSESEPNSGLDVVPSTAMCVKSEPEPNSGLDDVPSPAMDQEWDGIEASTPCMLEKKASRKRVACVKSEPEPNSGLDDVPSPAMDQECDGIGASTPCMPEKKASRKQVASTSQASGSLSKRHLTRSSSSIRPHTVMSTILNVGSEEDSDGGDDDELEPLSIQVPRVARPYMSLDQEADVPRSGARVSFSWPPIPHTSSSAAPITPPRFSTVFHDDVFSTSTQFASSPSTSPVPIISPPFASLSQNSEKNDFNWIAFPETQIKPELRREIFSEKNCGPIVLFASPYDAFTAIWNRDIMKQIATETNRFAQQLTANMKENGTMRPSSRILQWRDTNVDELYVYFAIIVATGIIVKSRIEEYWNSSQNLFSTPGFSALMSYNRFHLLGKCLHFQNNEGYDPKSMTRAQAKLFKLQPILDHLNNKFSQLYTLSQNIALDDSLTLWKDWLDINQFIHHKATSVGIKTYEVCESKTGYLWRFEVHAGHDITSEPDESSPVSGIVSTLVLRLLNGLEHKGHTVWMDSFYNSPALARELKVRGFDCVGTLRTDRQFVPVELTNLKKTDMEVGQVSGCTSGDVDLVVWRHKNRVAFVSTYHGLATTMCSDTLKPTVVLDYNICMGGVDRKDQMLAMYPIERRRTKIWHKKFFRRLLNASILNAYILCKANDTNKYTHRTFRNSLVKALVARHGEPTPSTYPSLPTFMHYPAQYGIITDSNKREHIRRSCAVCKKRTNAYCMACKVPL